MRHYLALIITLLPPLLFTACRSHYELTGVERTRIVVDSRYDLQNLTPPTAVGHSTPKEQEAVFRQTSEAVAFLAPYKQQVDSIMGPVMGRVAHNMEAQRPESDLSNLLTDILIWAGPRYGEKPALAVYNIGGMRAPFIKGTVTYGDVLDVAPFENKIAFLTLSGEQLTTLFRQMVARGGEGVSHGCELVASPQGELLEARLHGKEIDPQADYRIVTIDYLLGGNDGLKVLKDGRDVNSPQEAHHNVRFIIMDYFKEKAARGQEVDAQVEGRIVFKK